MTAPSARMPPLPRLAQARSVLGPVRDRISQLIRPTTEYTANRPLPMHRYTQSELATADLTIDAIYEGGRSGNAGDDPLNPLIGVSNQGGFRYLGTRERPHLIVLTSSFDDPDWPDRVDRETGVVVYFGDNKHPGRALHDTPRNGNHLLRLMFAAVHSRPARRAEVPPVLLFGNAGQYRDMVFLGLLVPGAAQLSGLEDLVAVWKVSDQQRFQNYRATFTTLDCPVVTRRWLDDIKRGRPMTENTPPLWQEWVKSGTCHPLQAERSLDYRTKAEQLPEDELGRSIIEAVRSRFEQTPVQFERCAAKLVQMMDPNFVSCDVTRPSRDGGRDAVGQYRVGLGAASIHVEYALEAKCYGHDNSVGTREVARLISRLRHRQFGVVVTTSFLHYQAYQEIKEDEHPVIVVAARDIVHILAKAGLTTHDDVLNWLEATFPSS